MLIRYGARGFGARLQAARETAGLTQEEVAAKIGASVNSISRWENDEATIPERHLEAMVRLYNREVAWLLSGLPASQDDARLLALWSGLSARHQRVVLGVIEELRERTVRPE